MEETRPLLVERRLDNADGSGHINRSSESSSTTTITAVLLLATFVAIFGSIGSGCASGYSSAAESGIRDDLGLTSAQYSVFASIFTVGAMVGATVSGKIADLIGRRGAIWLSDIFSIMGWLAILFAKGIWWLDLGRLALGFGAGILTYGASIYVAEITPKKIRGGFTAANMLMVCGGISLMFFIGNILTWRNLAIFGLVPCLVQSVGLFFIPESPRWLAKIGREKELEDTIQHLRGKKADIYLEVAEIRDYTKTFDQLFKTSILNLFERTYAHPLTIGVGLVLLVQFGGNNGILCYASSIFEAAGCSVSVGTTAMAIIQIPFTALNVFIVDKSGRRSLLMVSAAGTCLGNILVGLGFLFQGFNYSSELCAILVSCGILVYFASCAAGMNATPFVLMSEIFPVNIRGSAGSLVTFVYWFTAWIVSYSFTFLFDWSSPGVFFMFAAVCGSTILFVAKLVPETKGRSLEGIQASMTHVL
ncbi:hypothetical protein RHSIM_Rhsim05G0145500 [Rhododendron simsii]|uniref:Major facilitator superfamily (MFS) profile domain-containing protein n=1 Tax=Rhododendron simsii TaxID=118357 RepID=A0A834GXI6_RHOSS|nr:hypothetical protein RHSIM_Rhsim05G0145500 [Rhododendron simsii]